MKAECLIQTDESGDGDEVVTVREPDPQDDTICVHLTRMQLLRLLFKGPHAWLRVIIIGHGTLLMEFMEFLDHDEPESARTMVDRFLDEREVTCDDL